MRRSFRVLEPDPEKIPVTSPEEEAAPPRKVETWRRQVLSWAVDGVFDFTKEEPAHNIVLRRYLNKKTGLGSITSDFTFLRGSLYESSNNTWTEYVVTIQIQPAIVNQISPQSAEELP